MHESQRARVLVVDDNPQNIALMEALLQPQYEVSTALSGEQALALMAQQPLHHLVLLDLMMPGMNGYEVLERLRADQRTRDVPVILVTAAGGTADEERCLEQGAVDYIAKPIRVRVLLARVATHVELQRARACLVDQNHYLEAEVALRTAENQRIRDVSIHALARLAETRDNETGNHLRRTAEYVRILATRLQAHPRFAPELDGQTIDLMVRSAPLHDIGKVGIPDHILLKPGKLAPHEWAVMQTHARLGAEAIELAERDVGLEDNPGGDLGFLRFAKQIARSHHEKWDGSGYPEGLAGDQIPVAARLMALADVFDALICKRVYKPAWAVHAARDLVLEQRGRHFDPDVVDAFAAGFDECCDVALRFADPPEAALAA
ncbi:MAG TPA: two-component system response regulator [Ideonella sp.]|uniref:HD-GYP domain-containing protein n=1 Tax=Ideonella sp. TaxID=1929293 RepID=UPI002E34B92A|nr:two-component system response regulator [Ideonella sp.]HEX5683449.1 two-component system response regulator [Ideonella sp.]